MLLLLLPVAAQHIVYPLLVQTGRLRAVGGIGRGLLAIFRLGLILGRLLSPLDIAAP